MTKRPIKIRNENVLTRHNGAASMGRVTWARKYGICAFWHDCSLDKRSVKSPASWSYAAGLAGSRATAAAAQARPKEVDGDLRLQRNANQGRLRQVPDRPPNPSTAARNDMARRLPSPQKRQSARRASLWQGRRIGPGDSLTASSWIGDYAWNRSVGYTLAHVSVSNSCHDSMTTSIAGRFGG